MRSRFRVPAAAFGAAAVAALAGGGCLESTATLPDQGPIRPSALTFSVEPEYATAGFPVEPGVAVTVILSNGDTAYESTASIQLSIVVGSGTAGAHLTGGTTESAVTGTAHFTSVMIDSAGSGYRLLAVSPGLGGAASDTFSVAPGPPVRLGFLRQPGAAVAGDSIAPAVSVAVQDSLGNTVPAALDTITIALGANPGSATLGGATVRAAAAGVATFPGLTVSTAGSGYTLVATARSRESATSAPFSVSAALRQESRPGVRLSPSLAVVAASP